MSETDRDNIQEERKLIDKRTRDDSDDSIKRAKKKKYIKIGAIVGGVILVAVIITLAVVLTKKKKDDPVNPNPPTPDSPFDYQEDNLYGLQKDAGYQTQDWYINAVLKMNPKQLQQAHARLNDPTNGHIYKPVDPSKIVNDLNNKVADSVAFNLALVDNYQAQVIIQDATNPSHLVKEDVFQRPIKSFEARLTQVGYNQTDSPFSFTFGNIYNKETLISTKNRKLMVSEKFSEIGFVLPTKRIFGLGQSNRQFMLTNGTYTLWSTGRDIDQPKDNAEGYYSGSHIHPFLLGQTANKDFYGIFFLGTAAQSFEVVYFEGYNQVVLNYITLSGSMEMYFIMRGTAQTIISKYHQMIGYSRMPAYYALGVFQGSNAYDTLDKVQQVAANYQPYSIEGFIVETYGTKPNYVFDVDKTKFQDFGKYVDTLHANNQHIILGLDSGISNDPTFSYYTKATTQKCLVTSTLSNDFLVGYQDTTCVYPDFFDPAVEAFYADGIVDLDTQTNHFDGIVFKNTHFLNRINGEIYTPPTPPTPPVQQVVQKRVLDQVTEESVGNFEPYLINATQKDISTYYLPFIPGFNQSFYLDNHTISLNATHIGKMQELYVHNANGHMGLKRLVNVLQNTQAYTQNTKRPLVYSESTFAGSGNLGAALITDLYRSWDNLKTNIAQVMSMTMYGVSNVVTDICGSLGPLDEELCLRWAQVSAFLPMTRMYYNATFYNAETDKRETTDPSEIYNFKSLDYQIGTSSAINQRLTYSRYIYSQMYQVYREGGSLIRPLFFDYPEDDKCFENIESTFMLGDAIKVSPVLTAGVKDTYPVYFPKGKWADLNNYANVIDSKGENIDLKQSMVNTNIHLKEGKIIPFQRNVGLYKTTQDFQTKLRVSFLIHRDASQYAEGFIQVDDGISKNTYDIDQIKYTFWKLRFAEKSINFWVKYGDFNYEPQGLSIDLIEDISILQADDLADTDYACFMGRTLTPVDLAFSYNTGTKVLTFKPSAAQRDIKFKDIGFIKFGNSAKEPNFCKIDSAFTYQVDKMDESQQLTAQYNISSKQGVTLLDKLVVSATLLDDLGTINVDITTENDFNGVADKIKFRPPYIVDFTYFKKTTPKNKLSDYFMVNQDPFYYVIHEFQQPDKIIWQTDPHKLYFTDYLVFDSGIFSLNPNTNFPLMGMGERAGSLFYNNEQGGIHSRWNIDQANPIDDGLPPGRNMYGTQPFYVFQSTNTQFFGVFDLSSYAMDYILDFNNGINTQITNIKIGGIISKFFFRGNKPDDVITLYERLTGMPQVPPLWAFGWQQCRFGWKTGDEWWQVYENYTKFAIPLDTMWADIDYMDDYKLFTISESRYANLAKNVTYLKTEKNMTFVPIMDNGVAVRKNEGFATYDKGMEMDIFIKQADGSAPLTGGVWCGNAYYPDFMHPKINDFWHLMFDHLYNDYDLKFDGVWLDLNEATNFCNGYCIPSERPVNSLRYKPYYVPGWRDLEDEAIGVDGLHNNKWREYDVHNLYALTQVKSTAEYLQLKGLRPYVLSRSNFAGMGKFGHHWMGDNWSTVEYMKLSVDGVYSYSLFGLPFMGCDLCGFDGDAASDLCTKWHQLGTLFPFARNHNQNATKAQEPYRFTDEYKPGVTYTDLIKKAIQNRYQFIKYYYSQFHDIGEFGGSFFKPLFYEFPTDPLAYNDIQINMLLGNALKGSIQTTTLVEGSTVFYFPQGTWCQILPTLDSTKCVNSKGDQPTGQQTYQTNLPDYYIHIRNGFIVPIQDNTDVMTTKNLLDKPIQLYMIPNAENSAMTTGYGSYNAAALGFIYYDDGITLNQKVGRFDIALVLEDVNKASLQSKQVSEGTRRNNQEENLGTIQILQASVSKLQGVTKAQAVFNDDLKKDPLAMVVAYNKDQDLLTITVDPAATTSVNFYDLMEVQLLAA